MTEEIINGINVANCGYFCETDKECSICGMGTSGEDTFCRDCKDNSNCYYKKLKRLEQENKKLLEARNHFMGVNLKYFNALEEIKVISDNYNLTVNERRKQIADKINEVLNPSE